MKEEIHKKLGPKKVETKFYDSRELNYHVRLSPSLKDSNKEAAQDKNLITINSQKAKKIH